jgi:glycosyltransferase involved in cell wall biosynthesis
MRKRILFISTTNLASNPRVLKEIKLALPTYDVTFLGFTLGNWSDALEQKITAEIPSVQTIYLSASRDPFLDWFFSSLLERVSRMIWKLWRNNLYLTALASNKRTWLVLKRLKSMGLPRYDLIIGHTLGALYPAYHLGRRSNAKYAFDIEDYHPGERTDKDALNEKRRREKLMGTLLPGASYISYASPLIGRESLRLLGSEDIRHLPVNNSFPGEEFCRPSSRPMNHVEFVWFSLNISFGRGLEFIIPALTEVKGKVRLTLIGNLNEEFASAWIQPNSDFIKVVPPLPQEELHRNLSNFDIGLAFEMDDSDFNRHLALTNKIFAYHQAGLFILATDTEAQKHFIESRSESGRICKQNSADARESIRYIIENIGQIREHAVARYEMAHDLSWEKESAKLKELWNSLV